MFQRLISTLCVAALFGSTVFFAYRRFIREADAIPTRPVEAAQPGTAPEIPFEGNLMFAEALQSPGLSSLVDPSFEMRENVDFLLTPALLVQEAITQDTVITYPEE